jgi:hypothetical protein
MTEPLEHVVTAAILRTAIRAKLAAGTTRRTVSMLINSYVPSGTHAERDDDTGIKRLPVELIPHNQRTQFLRALEKLTDEAPAPVQMEAERLAS